MGMGVMGINYLPMLASDRTGPGGSWSFHRTLFQEEQQLMQEQRHLCWQQLYNIHMQQEMELSKWQICYIVGPKSVDDTFYILSSDGSKFNLT